MPLWYSSLSLSVLPPTIFLPVSLPILTSFQNKRLEIALTSSSGIEEEYRKTVHTLESKLVQLDLRNAELADENDSLRGEEDDDTIGVLSSSMSILKEELADRSMELEHAKDELRHVNAALVDRAATSLVLTELRQRVVVLEGIADNAQELELRNAGT